MWTKRYIFNPTKEEYFKTKHPIAVFCMLMPLAVDYLIITFGVADQYSWWLSVGFVGSLILGVGLTYTFAIQRKIYKRTVWPFLYLVVGVALLVVSWVLLF